MFVNKGRCAVGVRRWAAAVLVVVGVAFAGQAWAGSEMQQTFKAAKQNGENLVEVIRLALQSGAELNAVAAAADEAGIGMDIVTAAALAAGMGSPKVARTVEQATDANLGYLEPAGSKPLSDSEATSGVTEGEVPGFLVSQSRGQQCIQCDSICFVASQGITCCRDDKKGNLCFGKCTSAIQKAACY